MKVKLDVNNDIEENEIIIRCNKLDDEILYIQKILSEILENKPKIIFYKDNIQYYLSIEDILFIETERNNIYAHSKLDLYEVKYKLYELEQILPKEFIRVSKSTIVNVKKINSIERSITSSSIINFQGTYKKTYVSRYYYKDLRNRIEKVRGYYEK